MSAPRVEVVLPSWRTGQVIDCADPDCLGIFTADELDRSDQECDVCGTKYRVVVRLDLPL